MNNAKTFLGAGAGPAWHVRSGRHSLLARFIGAVLSFPVLAVPSVSRAQQIEYDAVIWGTFYTDEASSSGGAVTYAPGPGGVYDAGPKIQASLSYDTYSYPDALDARVSGASTEVGLYAGGTFQIGSAQLTLLAGPALVRVIEKSPNIAEDHTAVGARGFLSLSASFLDASSVSLSGSYSTIERSYWATGNALMPLSPKVRLGPSATISGNRNYVLKTFGPLFSARIGSQLNLSLSGGIAFKGGDKRFGFVGFAAGAAFGDPPSRAPEE